MQLPSVGMRTVKTAVAAFICFLISILVQNKPSLYAVIAAILCMQQDLTGSIRMGVNRLWGTGLGGVYGFLLLTLINNTFFVDAMLPKVTLVSFALIPLIYICVRLKQTNATYITCVVFLSVVVTTDTSRAPYLFALTRMLETALGVAISIIVNRILPNRKAPMPDSDILIAASRPEAESGAPDESQEESEAKGQ